MSDTPRDEPRPARAVRRTGGRQSRIGKPARPGRPAQRAEQAEQAGSGGTPGVRRRIGIRELRQHASIYVDLAERGYTVDITNRGRLVARLVPVGDSGSPLERLIAAGIVEPAEEAGGVADIEPYPATARPPATGEERR